MRYRAEIEEILSLFHESWMNDDDKAEAKRMMLEASGKTMAQWDADFSEGVRNGYPIAQQVALAKQLFKALK